MDQTPSDLVLRRRERQARFRDRHRNRLNAQRRAKAYHLNVPPQRLDSYYNVARCLAKNCRQRARQKGWVYDVTTRWVLEQLEQQDYRCLATDIPLRLNPDRIGDPYQPSIDRIDPSGGYTTDNCRVVCLIYNLARNGATDEEIIDFARYLLAKVGNSA
jgi:hypothetical protein